LFFCSEIPVRPARLEGFVTDAQVVSGHPILNEAAIDAVRQWQYSPTLLNGAPVPVLATVTIIFNLK
jgi:periplasmic protein TonB